MSESGTATAARGILGRPDAAGALGGAASLSAADFAAIVRAVDGTAQP